MNDKFDIDDILAEFDDDKKKNVNNEKTGKKQMLRLRLQVKIPVLQ